VIHEKIGVSKACVQGGVAGKATRDIQHERFKLRQFYLTV